MTTPTPPVMAPAPTAVVPNAFNSPFSSNTVVITVGVGKKLFIVHEAKLAQTKFFDIHGYPPTKSARAIPFDAEKDKTNTLDRVDGQDSIKMEAEGEDGSMQIVQDVACDYHLQDHFLLKPDAFNIFVGYLYNEKPAVPTSTKTLKTMLRAYGIAREYECFGLQNRVMDCIRSYYSTVHVKLDDLVWASNRFGDNTGCPLNAYLVEQVAFEIVERGLPNFTADNAFTVAFLEQGDRAIRGSLFGALARLAQNATPHDPATSRIKYHVHERGDRAGRLKE